MSKSREMNAHRQIKIRLQEAGISLQFLKEDIDSIEFIRENVASQIEQLLQEVTKKLRKSADLLNLEMKRERDKKSKGKGEILENNLPKLTATLKS
jgi:hypothetical protein